MVVISTQCKREAVFILRSINTGIIPESNIIISILHKFYLEFELTSILHVAWFDSA